MDFYDVVNTRRSVREYSKKDIPNSIIEKILLTAGKAPSGRNRQNWKYILVFDEKTKKQMLSFCDNKEYVINSPVTVVVCGKSVTNHNRGQYMGEFGMLMDVAITFDHFTLAARAEGLGTCWIGRFSNIELKKLLGIPEEWNIVALSPLGYPLNSNVFNSESSRLSLENLVSVNRFDDKINE